jgi:hypothetical protein
MAKKSKQPVKKSAFVRDFITANPEANRKAVEEAWLAAGHDGAISSALVSNIRARMGLTANVQNEPGAASTSAAATKKSSKPKGATGKGRGSKPKQAQAETNGTTAALGSHGEPSSHSEDRPTASSRGGHQGKMAFVRDFIEKNPKANRKAVEEAWLAAGHDGPISSALVSNLRSEMGLTRRRRRRTGKARVGGTAPEATLARKPRSGGRGGALAGIERDLDHLIFKLMGVGGMEGIEDELRKVRRLLYRSQSE